jgi:hypothetical protein
LGWAALRRVDECSDRRIVVEPCFADDVKRISEAMRANEEELEQLATTSE